MVGFTEPNRYEPRLGWRVTLEQWMDNPPADNKSWQHHIGRYWTARVHHSLSMREAWRALRMEPAMAKAALDAGSPDSGCVPHELFSHVLARSRATAIKDGDNVDKVVIADGPAGELPDKVEDGFSQPPKYSRTIYQPRARWMQKLVTAPGNATGWLADLHHYWRYRTQGGMSVKDAWKKANMDSNNADIAIHKDNVDRGAIPPELIGRVVERARGTKIAGIFLYPEPRL